MNFNKALISLLTLIVFGSVSCVIGQGRVPLHLTEKTVTVGKHKRTYYLFIPRTKGQKKLPVVFVFHGGGGTGLRLDRWLKFTELARKKKFIAVYPQGIGNNWNDGRDTKVNRAHKEKIDDLSFVEKMVSQITNDYPVDEDRFFATGPSNGGIFSHFIGAQMSDKFAAIAPVIGGIADPFYKKFEPSDPVSVFVIQGTADPLVPYNGGVIGRNRGRIISTDKALRLWRDNNETGGEPLISKLPDSNRRDGCKVDTYSWKNDKNGTEVLLYKAVGAGHTWPGASQYAPKFLIGGVCKDFDATKAIWEFFDSHPKSSNKKVAKN